MVQFRQIALKLMAFYSNGGLSGMNGITVPGCADDINYYTLHINTIRDIQKAPYSRITKEV